MEFCRVTTKSKHFWPSKVWVFFLFLFTSVKLLKKSSRNFKIILILVVKFILRINLLLYWRLLDIIFSIFFIEFTSAFLELESRQPIENFALPSFFLRDFHLPDPLLSVKMPNQLIANEAKKAKFSIGWRDSSSRSTFVNSIKKCKKV